MHNVISFSGGRTSAYLVHLIEQKRKAGEIDNVHYVFMDTGAEHPKTYEFVRNCVEHFGIDLTCIRSKVTPELGIGITYKEVGIDEIGVDFQVWADFVNKYSTPYTHGPHCTPRLKTEPYTKWCNEKLGKGNYVTWLGIRADEPRRLRFKEGYRYMAEISRMEKHDILGWWKEQPFDLDLDEWLGNCMFCLKKGTNKIVLAARAEPEFAKQWDEMLSAPEVKTPEKRKHPNNAIYRNAMSLPNILAAFEPFTDDQIKDRMRSSSGACTESCEVFGCQGDLFAEQE